MTELSSIREIVSYMEKAFCFILFIKRVVVISVLHFGNFLLLLVFLKDPLADYGRFVNDGEIQIRFTSDESKKAWYVSCIEI